MSCNFSRVPPHDVGSYIIQFGGVVSKFIQLFPLCGAYYQIEFAQSRQMLLVVEKIRRAVPSCVVGITIISTL